MSKIVSRFCKIFIIIVLVFASGFIISCQNEDTSSTQKNIDEMFPENGEQALEWLLEGKLRTSGRYTFITHKYYTRESPLEPSGLIGPVILSSTTY